MLEGEMEAGSSITINLSAWYTGTGSFPDLNQRRAAEYETPCFRAHSFRFTVALLTD
jgi:hypothetical protein